MPTDKLNLPTITGNMSADVPRDVNALAEAIDGLAGTPGGHALLEADGMIPSSQMRPIPGLSTHMNDLIKHTAFAEATGTANNYAVTISPAPSGYSDGLSVAVKINVNATGASTLNVNNLGARPIRKANGSDVLDLKANGIYSLRYNATTQAFISQGEGGLDVRPGDEVILADRTVKHLDRSLTLRKYKEFTLKEAGVVRVKFDLSTNNNTLAEAEARIYVNGAPVGILREIVASYGYVTFSEDIQVRTGDKVQIYARHRGDKGSSDYYGDAYLGYTSINIAENPFGVVG